MAKEAKTKAPKQVKPTTIKVRCEAAFYDTAAKTTRSRGDEFEVTADRLEEIRKVERGNHIRLVEVL